MPTRAPFLTTVPATGVWRITRPLWTVELGASEGWAFSPALRSVVWRPAVCR